MTSYEAECLARVQTIRREAARELEKTRRPDWHDPYVSYIPNYGVRDELRAICDFNRLRPLLKPGSPFSRYYHRRINQSGR